MSVTFTHTAVYQSALSAERCRTFAQSLQHGTLDTDLSGQMPYLLTVYTQGFSFSGKSGYREQILFPVIRLQVLNEPPCLVRVNIQPNLTALLAGPLTRYYNLSGWTELLLACVALALLSLIAYLSIFLPIEQGRQWIIDQLKLRLVRPKAGGRRK